MKHTKLVVQGYFANGFVPSPVTMNWQLWYIQENPVIHLEYAFWNLMIKYIQKNLEIKAWRDKQKRAVNMKAPGAPNFHLSLSRLNDSVLMLNLCWDANFQIILCNVWKWLRFQSFEKFELLQMFYCFIIFCWVGIWSRQTTRFQNGQDWKVPVEIISSGF